MIRFKEGNIEKLFSLVEEQKEFSVIDKFISGGYGTDFILCSLDILKLIELYDKDGGIHIKHWLDMSSKVLVVLSGSNISPQTAFVWLEDNPINIIGTNSAKDFLNNFQNSEGFLNYLKNRLVTDVKNGEIKYNFKPSEFKYGEDIYKYLSIYKYIALCISGQLEPNEPGEFDIMINDSSFKEMKVNYKMHKRRSKESLINILHKCIKDILYIYEEK